MDHDRTLARAVGGHVLEGEALRQIEIELDRGALPHPADGILDLEVDLGAVEGTAALIHLVGPPLAIEGFDQALGGELPHRVVADRFLGTRGEVDLVAAEIEGGEDLLGEIEDRQDFTCDLLRQAEHVGVVLGEAAHPHQPVHHAGPLVPIDGAQLGPADRQLPVAAEGAGIGEHVEGAVHRLELVLPLVHLHRTEHRLVVEIQMTGGFPEADIGHVGGVEQLVARLEVELPPQVLNQQAHTGTAGMPEHKASAGLIFNREQVQVGAEAAVVAA